MTGVAAQALIGTGAVAAAGGVQSFGQAVYVSGQLLVGGGELAGATVAESEVIEALYTAGEVEAESAIEAAQKAIEAASTLRSTTPAVW